MRVFTLILTVILTLGCGPDPLVAPSFDRTDDSRPQVNLQKADSLQGEGRPVLRCSNRPQGHDPNGVHDLGETPHFEGWYYRISHPTTQESWVLIAAYWQDDYAEGHAFIELIHHPSGRIYKAIYDDVSVDSIQANAGEFVLKLDDLLLTANEIRGHFRTDLGESIYLDLVVDGCAYWGAPQDEGNRWTMGWATEMPGVPLRWHVHHLKAQATGQIETDEYRWSFNGYPLHQEKNWGRAFPSSWIWMQSNRFEGRPDVAFAAAGGQIFPTRWSPDGYMAGLRWRDQFFTWRTQDGHRFPEAKFSIDETTGRGSWRLEAENWRHRIEVSIDAPLSQLIPIDVPTDGGLQIGAVEHLAADMEIKVYRRSGVSWALVDTVYSRSTAVEAGGDVARSLGLIP